MRCRAGEARDPTTPDLPPLIVIAGATATGKTSLAIALSQQIAGAEIVSADSRQVYRGMDIATAKPTPDELAAAPHHCIDLVDPDEPFSAADYRREAHASLAEIRERGGLALLVGGTGLYLRAIARGLPLDREDHDQPTRDELEVRLRDDGLDSLVAELRERDPAGADSLDLRNPRRVVRALERTILTGSAAPPEPEGYPAPVTWLGMSVEPAAHRARIATRVQEHFERGLLKEAQRLRSSYPEDLPAFSAMGYREAFEVLADRMDIDEAKRQDTRRTWAYARRQGTWFRSEADITWIGAGEGVGERALDAVRPFLGDIGREDYAVER